jgi:hypothetical protein
VPAQLTTASMPFQQGHPALRGQSLRYIQCKMDSSAKPFTRRTAADTGHLVPLYCKTRADRAADETGDTQDKDPHSSCLLIAILIKA